MSTTPHLDSHSTTDPKPEILSAVQTGNRISRDGRNVRGIMHVRMLKKDDICWQRRLNHSWVGGGIAFRRVYPARAYTTVVVLVFRHSFHKLVGCHADFQSLTIWIWIPSLMNFVNSKVLFWSYSINGWFHQTGCIWDVGTIFHNKLRGIHLIETNLKRRSG